MDDSILDKVILSKQAEQMREFNPPEAVAALLKQLSNKEEDVLRRRYGLNGKEKQTLEEIGKFYNLTRERIRQIESTAVKKIRSLKNFHEVIEPIEQTIKTIIERNGGAVSKERLLEQVFEFSTDTSISRQSVMFILSRLLTKEFFSLTSDDYFRPTWYLATCSLEQVRQVIDQLLAIIREKDEPVAEVDLIQAYRHKYPVKESEPEISEPALVSYALMSQQISRNPFGDYGLTDWGSIVPRRMNDKIYLVLKKEGKPMHYTRIAERINKIHFDNRKAYPPTVHNELILNDRYVLVGRGIYALKEWGYKPGVVAEVIVDVLKKSDQPMSREQIVEAVLAQRLVKKNTIHLALTDQQKFTKLPDGRYRLAETKSADTQPGTRAVPGQPTKTNI